MELSNPNLKILYIFSFEERTFQDQKIKKLSEKISNILEKETF